jgi:hypothetical protein
MNRETGMYTSPTFIELLEYVLRNPPWFGVSVIPLFFRNFMGDQPLSGEGRPLEELEDTVSNESVPCSNELEVREGTGGAASEGASRPFFVVDADREPRENNPLAFGAEATRRMKRVAEAPIDLGESGPFVLGFEGMVGLRNGTRDGSAVSGFMRGEFGLREMLILCFSDFVWGLVLP